MKIADIHTPWHRDHQEAICVIWSEPSDVARAPITIKCECGARSTLTLLIERHKDSSITRKAYGAHGSSNGHCHLKRSYAQACRDAPPGARAVLESIDFTFDELYQALQVKGDVDLKEYSHYRAVHCSYDHLFLFTKPSHPLHPAVTGFIFAHNGFGLVDSDIVPFAAMTEGRNAPAPWRHVPLALEIGSLEGALKLPPMAVAA